jgi:3-oxoacyl-[acyl-carrier-protein] synthase-3
VIRVDWIEVLSFAGDFPLCMSCGTPAEPNGRASWQDFPTYGDAERAGALLIRQDLKTLENIVRVGIEGYLRLQKAGRIRADEIDHFVCHYSSHYFRGKTLDLMRLMGCLIPEERWFTNLYTKGNTGCAAVFIMLEELLYGGRLRPGQTVFCFVPESGRFTTAYLKLSVVQGGRS